MILIKFVSASKNVRKKNFHPNFNENFRSLRGPLNKALDENSYSHDSHNILIQLNQIKVSTNRSRSPLKRRSANLSLTSIPTTSSPSKINSHKSTHFSSCRTSLPMASSRSASSKTTCTFTPYGSTSTRATFTTSAVNPRDSCPSLRTQSRRSVTKSDDIIREELSHHTQRAVHIWCQNLVNKILLLIKKEFRVRSPSDVKYQLRLLCL